MEIKIGGHAPDAMLEQPDDDDYWSDDDDDDSDDEEDVNLLSRFVIVVQKAVKSSFESLSELTKGYLTRSVLVCLYIAYFIAAMIHE